MAFPNVSDIIATTIERRSGKIADSVTLSNAALAMLKKKGRIKPAPGGRLIYEELAFADNTNTAWYSGYDTLSVAASDVLTAAEYNWKQAASPVVISGLEQMQNSGEDAFIDLLDARVTNAENSLKNLIAQGLWSDGTGNGGKEIVGFDAMVPQDPTTGTYGGINRATSPLNVFWRSQLYDPASTPISTTIQQYMNTLWLSCIRGTDKPDLILSGNTIYATFWASMQAIQRITNPQMAELGFSNTDFSGAPVVPDSTTGIVATDMVYLNCQFMALRPHVDRNFRAMKMRSSVNQDADVQHIFWGGALTASACKFHGRLKGD